VRAKHWRTISNRCREPWRIAESAAIGAVIIHASFGSLRRLVRHCWFQRETLSEVDRKGLCLHVSTVLSATDVDMIVALAIALDVTIAVHAEDAATDARVLASTLIWRGPI
jgi:hypothetical protein